ncbi:MAG: hypothetical protein IKB65_08225 [Ruminiclostridium sp.]|nr:hypothetical protein [Ruminiclostridium sp.]
MAMEDTRDQEYFIKSRNVWFPDFEKEMERKSLRYQKSSFPSMLALLCYFRSEITRNQFLSEFLTQKAPDKMLSTDKLPYLQIKEYCLSYQNKEISDAEFDEKILLSFCARPLDGVFSPPFASWNEVVHLISRVENKTNHLPFYFDGLGWVGYLKGNVTRYLYVKTVCDAGDHLCQLLQYGSDAVKEDLNDKYSMEVSVALRLRELCMKYKDGSLSSDEFDCQYLQLAKDFCSDILE